MQMYHPVPPPPPTKRNRLPLILTLVGIAVPILIVFWIFVLRGVLGAVSPNPTSGESTLFQNDRIEFSVPAGFERQGDNVTHVDLGGSPSERIVWRVGDKDNQGVSTLIYELSASGDTTEIPYEQRIEGMEIALDNLDSIIAAGQMADSHATVGLGCAGGFEFLTRPHMIDRDGIVGVYYEYECQSFFGEAHGQALMFYDAYGSVHRVWVDALSSHWSQHAGELSHVIESVKSNI